MCAVRRKGDGGGVSEPGVCASHDGGFPGEVGDLVVREGDLGGAGATTGGFPEGEL